MKKRLLDVWFPVHGQSDYVQALMCAYEQAGARVFLGDLPADVSPAVIHLYRWLDQETEQPNESHGESVRSDEPTTHGAAETVTGSLNKESALLRKINNLFERSDANYDHNHKVDSVAEPPCFKQIEKLKKQGAKIIWTLTQADIAQLTLLSGRQHVVWKFADVTVLHDTLDEALLRNLLPDWRSSTILTLKTSVLYEEVSGGVREAFRQEYNLGKKQTHILAFVCEQLTEAELERILRTVLFLTGSRLYIIVAGKCIYGKGWFSRVQRWRHKMANSQNKQLTLDIGPLTIEKKRRYAAAADLAWLQPQQLSDWEWLNLVTSAGGSFVASDEQAAALDALPFNVFQIPGNKPQTIAQELRSTIEKNLREIGHNNRSLLARQSWFSIARALLEATGYETESIESENGKRQAS